MSVCNLDHGRIQLIISNVPNIEKRWNGGNDIDTFK